MKKGIKIRKIGSSSGKKIEPLSYGGHSQGEGSIRREGDLERLEVGYGEYVGMGGGKYIRPIQKYKKEY